MGESTWPEKVSADTCVQPRKPHSCVDTRHLAIRVNWHSKSVLTRRSEFGEVQKHKLPPEQEYGRVLWYEINVGVVPLKAIDEQVPRTPGALLVDAKDIYDGVKRSELAALSVTDKMSTDEGPEGKFGTC